MSEERKAHSMIDLNEVRHFETPSAVRSDESAGTDESAAKDVIPEPLEPNRDAVERGESRLQSPELSALKRKCLNLAAERELALALAGEALIPGVTDQLLKLLKDRIVAEETADQGIRVASRDGRPVAEAVKEWLGSHEYRHFRSANSRGGVLRRNESTMHAGTAEIVADPAGRSLNELVIERWKNRVRTKGKEGFWPRIP